MRMGVFIPVRLDSTRLPQKALLEIAGQPAIGHLIERLKLAQVPDIIIICTSGEPSDDPLQELADRYGVELFRGSKEDLLDRFHQATLAFNIDLIINVDGDDILVDPEQVDFVADYLLRSGADFVKLINLPFGAAPVGLKAAALTRVCETKDREDTATGWGRYFTDYNLFNVKTVAFDDPTLNHPEIRLTLDYPEDFRLFEAVFQELYRKGAPVRLREAIKLILSRPDIRALNSGLEERYWTHFNSAVTPTLKSS